MIQCSFCSSSKCQKYIYASCQHFICINCASLRLGQSLICCNKVTRLDEQVKQQLKNKKQVIMYNLQNGYQYEKTDVNKINYDDIQERIRKIQQMQDKSNRREMNTDIEMQQTYPQKQNKKQQKYRYREQLNKYDNDKQQQMESTPINQFYKNPLILKQKQQFSRQLNKVQMPTPIKIVMNEQQFQLHSNIFKPQSKLSQPQYKMSSNQLQSMLYNQQLKRINQVQKTKTKRQQISIRKQQFIPILQNNIYLIRDKFKSLYDKIQKLQANAVYQMKIYFQEYVKLIQKQTYQLNNINVIIQNEKLRVNNFLQQYIQKWRLQQIDSLLNNHQRIGHQQKQLKFNNDLKIKQENHRYIENEKMNNCLPNNKNSVLNKVQNQLKLYEFGHNDLREQEKQNRQIKIRLQKLKTQNSEVFNKISNRQSKRQLKESNNILLRQYNNEANSSNRNLDKIYRKLQQSRSKLQERIQIHNQFMTNRCLKFNN